MTVDSFTDAVDARVSFPATDRVTGGLGFVADTTRPWGEGEFVLRGSVDVERLLSGVETRVQVSGERLSAEATEHSLRFGLKGCIAKAASPLGRKWRPARRWGRTTANTPASSMSACSSDFPPRSSGVSCPRPGSS